MDAAARGYHSALELEPAELDHLPAAMAVRPAVLACWMFATGRSPVADAAAWWANEQRKLLQAADRARAQMTEARTARRSRRSALHDDDRRPSAGR